MEQVKDHIQKVKAKEISLEEFGKEAVEKAKEINAKYNAFIAIANNIEFGPISGKLAGLPIAVKDNICTAGLATTAGSKILEGYMPPFDATAVSRAKQEGAGIVGKTAMDEFGFGTFSTNCAYAVPKNPLDPERTCGGSSGGAACAVAAADFPLVSIAESTGGSITCPAAFTGTVGITPTYGLVSRWGLIDYANSLDKIGTIGKSTYDAALLLEAIAGKDEMDATSVSSPKVAYTDFIGKDCKGMKVGIVKEYLEASDEQVAKQVLKAVEALEKEGVECDYVSLPSTDLAIPTYYIISMSEASTNLAKFSGLRYGLQLPFNEESVQEYFANVRTSGFGEEAKRRLILGTFMRMAGYRDQYYIKALKVRSKIIREFKQAFAKYDLLIAPSMPIIAPKFSEIEKLEPVQVYAMDVLTVGPNLAGMPTISLPFGKAYGMPVGVQLIGDHFQEAKLVQLASFLEALT